MNKTIGNKTQSIPIGEIKGSELVVNFDWEIVKHPTREEEGHGNHFFNEDEEKITINSVALVILGIEMKRFLPKELNSKQISAIGEELVIDY